jgi:hypothetical protein
MAVVPPIYRRLDQLRELFHESRRPSQPALVSALIQCAPETVEELQEMLDRFDHAYPKDTLLDETRDKGFVNLPKPPRAK